MRARVSFRILFGMLALAVLLAQNVVAQEPATQNYVYPDELFVEPPTLENLGFEWFIRGDDNRNATVEVAYRKVGDEQWLEAMPMLRIGGERIYVRVQWDVELPPMFAGSIMDLEPDTEYEARFTISDPDGVRGEAVRKHVVKTRPEPMPYAHGRIFHVYPHGFEGEKMEPSFEGL
ncbi:MAG: hypothetical protein R3332_10385 [Pseudohongiellaceae bacterium]|nr:hypothetical protein [Pseudohongiellaceae bacterium]